MLWIQPAPKNGIHGIHCPGAVVSGAGESTHPTVHSTTHQSWIPFYGFNMRKRTESMESIAPGPGVAPAGPRAARPAARHASAARRGGGREGGGGDEGAGGVCGCGGGLRARTAPLPPRWPGRLGPEKDPANARYRASARRRRAGRGGRRRRRGRLEPTEEGSRGGCAWPARAREARSGWDQKKIPTGARARRPAGGRTPRWDQFLAQRHKIPRRRKAGQRFFDRTIIPD